MWSCHSYLHWYAVKVPHSPGVVCSENFFGHGRRGKKVYIFPCPNSAAERNGGTNAHESCPQCPPEHRAQRKSVKLESDEERARLYYAFQICIGNWTYIQQVLVTKIDALQNLSPSTLNLVIVQMQKLAHHLSTQIVAHKHSLSIKFWLSECLVLFLAIFLWLGDSVA